MSPANFTVRMNATSTLPTSSYMMIVPETSGTTPENVSGNNFLENVPEQKNNSSLSTFLILMLSICVSGILLNLIVLCRRKRRRCSSAMRTSLFLLSTMALADTLCLIALLLFLTMRFITAANNPIFLNFFCKINTFVIHSTSAFSIWCWLVLSSVRYMAIYRPYSHLKINRQPRYAVIALSIFCCVIELWVLWDSDYIEEAKMCGNAITSGATAEMLHLFQIGEIILSYFLPAAVIIAMDLKVLLGRSIWMAVRADEKNGNALEVDSSDSRLSEKRPTRNVQDSTDRPGEDYSEMKEAIYESGRVISGPSKLFDNGQIKLKRNRSGRKVQQMKVLRRCLCITIFDLSMNLPSYLLRLYAILFDEPITSPYIMYVQEIAEILYFAQFALNAVYLACIIYDAPKESGNKMPIPVSAQVSSAYLSASPRVLSTKKSVSKREDF